MINPLIAGEHRQLLDQLSLVVALEQTIRPTWRKDRRRCRTAGMRHGKHEYPERFVELRPMREASVHDEFLANIPSLDATNRARSGACHGRFRSGHRCLVSASIPSICRPSILETQVAVEQGCYCSVLGRDTAALRCREMP